MVLLLWQGKLRAVRVPLGEMRGLQRIYLEPF